jgi:ABC-type molybdate transport system substrate-binding protein
VIADAANADAARAFIDLVLGPEGRAVLAKHGLMAPSTTP